MLIKKKIIFSLLASAIIPIIIVGTLSFLSAEKALKNTRIAALESIADLKAKSLENYFDNIKKDITAITENLNLANDISILVNSPAELPSSTNKEVKRVMDKTFTVVQQIYKFLNIMITNAKGEIIYALDTSDASVNLENSHLNAEGRNGVYFLDSYIADSKANQFDMVAVTPLYDHRDTFIGEIIFKFPMEPMYTLIGDTTGLGETGETLLATRTGNSVLFLNPLRHDANTALQRKVPMGEKEAIPIQEALSGRNGQGFSIDYRGKEVLAVWRYIPSLQWGMVAKIDVSEAFSSVATLRMYVTILLLATILIAILIAQSVARTIADPIHSLHKGVEALGSGNLDYKIGTPTDDEIGQLGKAFNQMIDDLKAITASRDDLTKEVDKRKEIEQKLRESRRSLLTFMGNLQGMAFRCRNDKDWTMDFTSEGCFHLTGYRPSQLIQNSEISYGQLIHPDDQARVWNEVQAAVQEKRSFRLIYRIITATGEQKWVYEQGIGTFSPQDKLIALEGISIDITKNKATEEKIERLNLLLITIRNVNKIITKGKDETRLLQDICDNLIENRVYHNAWIVQLDKSGNLVSTAHAGFGSKVQTIIDMLERRDLPDCAKKALMQSAAVKIEDPHSTCPNCLLLSEDVSRGAASVRLEHHENIYGVLSVSMPKYFVLEQEEQSLLEDFAADIAMGLYGIELEEKHKQADEKILKSEKRFRTLIENSLSGFAIIQGDKVVYQNPEQERLLGPLPRTPKFIDIENIYPDDVEKVKKYYEELSSVNPPIQDLDFRFYPKDKTKNYQDLIWVHCRSVAVEYQGKASILTNLTDITPIKRMEHLLRIQDKMESLGRIASGVAHEIRNPLSGVNVFLDSIREDFEDPDNAQDIKEMINQAKGASNKIESIVKRVLDFSRPSLPKLELKDINIPIKEAINLSQVSLRKKEVEVERNLSDQILQAHIDSQLIEQVLLNMITNAAEALKDIKGRKAIAIASTMEKDNIIIKIGDSGPGVEADIQEKIFDPFYTTRTDGSGIGLSICQRIISDHGGRIEVSKSELGGAEFVIRIPQHNA